MTAQLQAFPSVTDEAEIKTYHEVQFLLMERLNLSKPPNATVNNVDGVTVLSIVIAN